MCRWRWRVTYFECRRSKIHGRSRGLQAPSSCPGRSDSPRWFAGLHERAHYATPLRADVHTLPGCDLRCRDVNVTKIAWARKGLRRRDQRLGTYLMGSPAGVGAAGCGRNAAGLGRSEMEPEDETKITSGGGGRAGAGLVPVKTTSSSASMDSDCCVERRGSDADGGSELGAIH